MMRPAFRAVVGFLKHFSLIRRRNAKPAELTRLIVEPLERRDLMSQNAWMPQRFDPLDGVTLPDQFLQMFRPATGAVTPELGLASGTVSLTANLLVVNSGSYDLSFEESGTLGDDTFIFSEEGTVTYSLYETGTYTSGNYSFDSVSLTQTASLNWSLARLDSAGNTISSQNGSNTFTLTSLGTAVVDPMFWKGFNWDNLTNEVIQSNSLGIDDASASTFTVNETNGSELYTFSLTGGLMTITGVGVQPLPDMMQGGTLSSTQTYNYTRSSAFSFANHGVNNFSLTETGSRGPAFLVLDSITYTETADHAAEVPTGYAFEFSDAGTIVKAGTGHDTEAQTGQVYGISSIQTSTRDYSMDDAESYSYSESGIASQYAYAAAGSFSAGSFSFASITYDSGGSATYVLNLHQESNSAGSFTTTRIEASAPGDALFHSLASSQSGSYSSSQSVTRSETGVGAFSMSDDLSYSGGAYSFATVGRFGSATATYALTQRSAETQSGSGTFSQIDSSATQSTTRSGTFTDFASSIDTYAESGSAGYTMSEGGYGGAGVYGLLSYVIDSHINGVYTVSSSGLSAQTGVSVDTDSSNALTTTGIGFDASLSTSTYGYNSSAGYSSTETGTLSQSTYQAGDYSENQFALNSVALLQTYTSSWLETGWDQNSSSGTIASTEWGANQIDAGEGVNGTNILNSSLYTHVSTTRFSSTSSDEYSQYGSDTGSNRRYGSFVDQAYSFSSLVDDASGFQTGTTQSSGVDTYISSNADSDTSWSNQGPITPPGTDTLSVLNGAGSFTITEESTYDSFSVQTWNQASTGTSNYSSYQAGQYSNGAYSLSSLTNINNSSQTWSYQQFAFATSAGTDSITASGAGSLVSVVSSGGTTSTVLGSGSYIQTSQNTFSSTSYETLIQSGADTAFQSQQGIYSLNSFSLDSVIFQSSSNQSSTSQLSGQDDSTGLSTLNYTSSISRDTTTAANASSGYSLNSVTQSGTSTYSPTASQSYSQTENTTTSWSLYESGAFLNQAYSFGSVAYSESDTDDVYSNTVENGMENGTDVWNVSNLYVTQNGWTDDQIHSIGDQVTSESARRSDYSNASSNSSVETSTSYSSLVQAGVYSDGSFAFSSSVQDASGSDTGFSNSTDNSLFTTTGTDSVTESTPVLITSPDGISQISNQSNTTGSISTFTQIGTDSAIQTSTYSTGYIQHQEGSYGVAGWNMTLVSYSASANAADWGLDTANSTSTGVYVAYGYGTSSDSMTSAGADYLDATQSSTSFNDVETGSYNQSSTSTATQHSNYASTFSEVGTYDPVNGYAFSSVVYQADSDAGGTYDSLATGSSSSSSTKSTTSTNASNGTNSWTSTIYSSVGSNMYSTANARNDETISYQEGTSNSTMAQSWTSTDHQYQAGIYAASAYAFSSVVFESTSDQTYSYEQSSVQTTSGTCLTTITNNQLNLDTVVTTQSTSDVLSIVTNTSTSSSVGTTTSSNSFDETSAQTYTESGSSHSASTQNGVFAAGSYAFSDTVYQQTAHSASTLTQSDSSSFTNSGTTSATSTSSYGTVSYYANSGGVSTYSTDITWSNSANGTFWQHGDNTATSSNYSVSTSTLYQEGESALGSTSLSSIVADVSSVQTTSSTSLSNMEQSGGNSTSAYSVISSTSNNGISVWSESSTQYASSDQISVSTINRDSVTTTSLVQLGSQESSGVYHYSSITLDVDQHTTQSSYESQTEYTTQGSAHTKTIAGGGLFTVVDNTQYANTTTGGSSYAYFQSEFVSQQGVNQIALENDTVIDSAYHAAGTYDGADANPNGYNLSDVSYDVEATNTVNVTQTSNVTSTGGTSSSSYDGSWSLLSMQDANGTGSIASTGSTYSSTDTSDEQNTLTTQTNLTSAYARFYQAGTLQSQSYTFSDIIYDSSVNTNSTVLVSSINSATQTSVQSAYQSYVNTGVTSGAPFYEPYAARASGLNSITTTIANQEGSGSSFSYSASTLQVYNAEHSDQAGVHPDSVVYFEETTATSSATQNSHGTLTVLRSSTANDSYWQGDSNNQMRRFSYNTVNSSSSLVTFITDGGAGTYTHARFSEIGTAVDDLQSVTYDADGVVSASLHEQQTQDGTDINNSNSTITPITTAIPVNANVTTTSSSHTDNDLDSRGTYTYSIHQAGQFANGCFSFASVVYDETVSSTQTYTADSGNTYSSLAAGSKYSGNNSSNQSSSLHCWQISSDAVHAEGSSVNGDLSLSCYTLDLSSQLNATKDTTLSGNHTYTGDDDQGYGYGGDGWSVETQSETQSQLNKVRHEGVLVNGNYLLSLVSSTNQANYSATDDLVVQDNNNDRYAVSTNFYTVSAAANGSFTALVRGSAGVDADGHYQLSISTYSLSGGSGGSYVLNQSGSVFGQNGGTFSHDEMFEEANLVNVVGYATIDFTQPNLGACLSYSIYSTIQTLHQTDSDVVKNTGGSGDMTRSVTIALRDDGSFQIRSSGSGSASVNGRGATYTKPYLWSPTDTWSPTLYFQWRTGAPPSLLSDGHFLLPRALSDIGKVLGATVMPAMLGGQMSAVSGPMMIPPQPIRFAPGAPMALAQYDLYAQLVRPDFTSLGTNEGQLQMVNWWRCGIAYQDVLYRITTLGTRPTMTMYGKDALNDYATALGAAITGDLVDNVGNALDFLAGIASVLTAGLSNRLLNVVPYGSFIDQQSVGFALGQLTGTVIAMVLPNAGLIGLALQAMQVVGNVWNAVDAARAGDYFGMTQSLLFAGLSATCLAQNLRGVLPQNVVKAAELASQPLSVVAQAFGAVSIGTNLGTALVQFASGDYTHGLLSLGHAAVDLYSATRSCFPGEVKGQTNRGWLRVDEMRVGDRLDACWEGNPHGPVEGKRIQQIFVLVARIWCIRINGRILRTTAEHPFFVFGKGWVQCNQLQPGDVLRSANGRLIAVEEVWDSGVFETVYNFRIENYHTFFVGDEDWGFTVWAHNACSSTSGENKAAASGRAKHKQFSDTMKAKKDPRFVGAYGLPSGKKVDGLKFNKDGSGGIVYELKPAANPKSEARGQAQLRDYVPEVASRFGGTWRGVVIYY